MTEHTQKTLLDFSSPPEEPYWRIVNDRVMGGVSQSSFTVTPDQTGLFQGTLSLEQSGGFSSLRFIRSLDDLSNLSGFLLRCRGDGKQYQFRVYPGPHQTGPTYTCSFVPPVQTWGEISMPLEDFNAVRRGRKISDSNPLRPESIHQVGLLIADEQEGEFWLEIDRISIT